eukprot:snap_masked-scaffold405_size181423-processed-gene-0.1 protein:Tk08179 transcript:snap_masked-scaffold405_size181423-processed-gene-0.1-mRNA-1 annotation:"facilitated trehalose transporter tret1-like isoform x2"
MSLGCFFGCIVCGPVMEKLGRKPTLMLVTNGIFILGYMLIFLALNEGMLLTGRFFTGSGLGFAIAVCTVYVIEITSTDMRSSLGCFVQLFGTLGVLYTFSLGAFLDWYFLALANLAFVPPLAIGMLFVPESPRWLILQGREVGARESLEWLRGRGNDEWIQAEIDKIKRDVALDRKNRITLRDLQQAWRPFALSLGLMFLAQFCGLSVLIYYTVSIFNVARSSVDPRMASILVGLTLVLSSGFAVLIVPRLNRRLIVLTSLMCMTMCMVVLGTCLYFIEQTPPEEDLAPPLGWLPVVTVLLFLFVGNGGFETLIWILTAELLPPKVRSVANSLAICFAFLVGFVVSKTFVDLVTAIRNSGAFWLYAAINLAGFFLLAYFLPETKDRSIEEIQKKFTRITRVSTNPDYEELVGTTS